MQSDISKSSDICFVEVKNCFQQKQSVPMISVLEYADDGVIDAIVVIKAAVDDVAVMIACVLRKPTGLPVGKQHG